jgi:hypothetical protein
VLDIILKVLSALLGSIGAVLGVYNYIHARRKETREQREREAASEQEQREWAFYADFYRASREGLVLKPEDGSENHKLAEKFVAKGMLIRLPLGMGYAVPGQNYVVAADPKKNKRQQNVCYRTLMDFLGYSYLSLIMAIL